MARSGGRMLATLEPEQVITLADSIVTVLSCCMITGVKPADSVFIPSEP